MTREKVHRTEKKQKKIIINQIHNLETSKSK